MSQTLNPQEMKPMSSLEVKAVAAEVDRQYKEYEQSGALKNDHHTKNEVEANIRGTITGNTKEGVMSVSFADNVKDVTAHYVSELTSKGPQQHAAEHHPTAPSMAVAKAANGIER